MRSNKNFLWLAASATALMGFSFAAGYGLRALMWAVQGRVPALTAGAAGRENPFAGYPRLASRAGTETVVGHGQVFGEVMTRLRDLYVEQLPPQGTLSLGAVDQMLSDLADPNTRLITAKEWSALNEAQTGVFRGLGAVLTIRRSQTADDEPPRTQITVVAPMPGSPAEKAGLLPGDRITSIDEHWIAPQHLTKRMMNMLFEDIEYHFDPKMLNSTPLPEEERAKPFTAEERKQREEQVDRWRGSTDWQSALDILAAATEGEHTLTYERGDAPAKTIKVQFARLNVAPITKKKLAPGVGYLQVRQINADAVRAVDQALAEFKASGLKSLVLDLRRSPGGALEQAQALASRFLTSGAVAVVEKRDGSRKLVKRPLAVKPVDRRVKFTSIAVLVDGGTAGTSEVVAAALRDAGLAKLVGDKTFGDGSEQIIFPLENGAAISITTAKLLSRAGTDFDGKGLKPDVAVAPSAGPERALEQALRVVRPS